MDNPVSLMLDNFSTANITDAVDLWQTGIAQFQVWFDEMSSSKYMGKMIGYILKNIQKILVTFIDPTNGDMIALSNFNISSLPERLSSFIEQQKSSVYVDVKKWNKDSIDAEIEVGLPITLKDLHSYPELSMLKRLCRMQEFLTSINPMLTQSSSSFMDTISAYETYYNDISSLVPPYKALATIFAPDNILTFDGKLYQFAGSGTYILVTDVTYNDFTILVTYENQTIDSMTIYLQGNELVVKSNLDFEVNVDFDWGYYKSKYYFEIGNELFYFTYDRREQVYNIELTGFHHSKLVGLLGNCDNEQFTDFITSSRSYTDSVNEFAESWKIRESRDSEKKINNPESVPELSNDEDRELCAHHFKNNLSPFRPCYSVIDPDIIQQVCMDRLSKAKNKNDAICQMKRIYQRQCHYHSVNIAMPSCDECPMVAYNGECIPENFICPTLDATSCYLIDSTNRDWQVAYDFCQTFDSSSLLVINDQDENEEVVSLIQRQYNESVSSWWLSGTDEGHHGIWKWVTDDDEISMNYTNWKNGQPNQWRDISHHLALEVDSNGGDWFDLPYNYGTEYTFTEVYTICEIRVDGN